MFLLVLPIVFAQDWIFNSEYLVIELDIPGKINLVPTRSSYDISYVIANLSFGLLSFDSFSSHFFEVRYKDL